MMLKNKRLQDRRAKISNEIDIYVNHSFDIVDRIHEILLKQGKEQKDLAQLLNKSESEISKWMSGTHNFTIKTIAKIESVLGESIIQLSNEKVAEHTNIIFLSNPNYTLPTSKESSGFPVSWNGVIQNTNQQSSKYLN
ncbi:hypothetical protein CYCD_18120 [Tenuifilaceae bacterium CYCD]|nr:hypothetical protein CYCD_18120 [Tenuifilaceae bacterium CYCD]